MHTNVTPNISRYEALKIKATTVPGMRDASAALSRRYSPWFRSRRVWQGRIVYRGGVSM
jgi:hypothetical protein